MGDLRNAELPNTNVLNPQAKAWQFPFAIFAGNLAAFWGRLLRAYGPKAKSLRLCENLPLGERRFVAVVEFEQTRFLIGGTPSTLVLLSRLGGAHSSSRAKTGFDTSRIGNTGSAIEDSEPEDSEPDCEPDGREKGC